jgi:23S rRNA pseudouridine2605 synthase
LGKSEGPKRGGRSGSAPPSRKSTGSSRPGLAARGDAKKGGTRKPGGRPSLTGDSGSKPLEERRSRPAAKTSRPAPKTSRPAAKTSRPAAKTSRPAPKSSRPAPKSSRPAPNSSSDLVRLNKYIAAAGICSRREADQLISAGLITVNGKSVTELGSKVNPADEVKYNGERIRTERKVYLLLNKPKDYVTTTDDPKERKTVMLLIREACSERVYPVGRLDRNTTGVLLFTNDGELAKKMTHPSSNKKKIYHVFLNKSISANDLKSLAEGVTLEDGFIQPDAVSYASSENKREVGLEIHSGKNRIVRRMFETLGYKVDKLDRVYYGGLTKKNVPRGKWRLLTEKEVTMLQMNAYE